MSFNLGATVANPVTLTPSPKTMTLTANTHGITGVNNDAVDVSAGFDSMSMSALAAQINEDVIVQPGFDSMSMTGQSAFVDYTPGQGDVTVDASNDSMLMSGLNVASIEQPVTIDVISDFNISVGQTINLINLYVTENTGTVTDSQVIGLNISLATYTHAGGLVGVAEGTMTGLTLEVTYT